MFWSRNLYFVIREKYVNIKLFWCNGYNNSKPIMNSTIFENICVSHVCHSLWYNRHKCLLCCYVGSPFSNCGT